MCVNSLIQSIRYHTAFNSFGCECFTRYNINPTPLLFHLWRYFSIRVSFMNLFTIPLRGVYKVLNFTIMLKSLEKNLLIFGIGYVLEALMNILVNYCRYFSAYKLFNCYLYLCLVWIIGVIKGIHYLMFVSHWQCLINI